MASLFGEKCLAILRRGGKREDADHRQGNPEISDAVKRAHNLPEIVVSVMANFSIGQFNLTSCSTRW
jgi:hypothetical protein